MRIAYQGEPGSFSEQAVWQRFAGRSAEPVPYKSFADAIEALLQRDVDAALLPVQNNRIGPIKAAVAAVEAAKGVEELNRFWMPIDLYLIGHADAVLRDIKRAYSHPAALAQAAAFLEEHGIDAVPAGDTAGAVREVRIRGDPAEAAIAGRRAAALHGMRVLAERIQDVRGNKTQFAVYRRVHR